nr:hypothetical protein BaRGS_002954 [Batillaria attramentaria]
MAAMDTLIQQQAATISGMQTSVQTLTSQMALQTPFVAFDVQYKDDPHNNVASHDILKFDAISMNIGNAYTASNGMFQAPVSGVYLFHVKLTPNPHGSIYAYLVKEGQNVDSVNAHDDTGNETGDTVRILQEPFVGFDVTFSDDPHRNVSDNDVMVFDKANVNIGDAYNTQNGTFQAPVSGLYVLYMKVTPSPMGHIYVYLVKDGIMIDSVDANDDQRHETGSSVRIVQVGTCVYYNNYHFRYNSSSHKIREHKTRQSYQPFK